MTESNRTRLEMIRCESIETTLRTRRLFLWAGALIRMSGGRLLKRIVFGNLEGAVRRGRSGKEDGVGRRTEWEGGRSGKKDGAGRTKS